MDGQTSRTPTCYDKYNLEIYTKDQIPFVVVEEIYNKQIKQTECKLMW